VSQPAGVAAHPDVVVDAGPPAVSLGDVVTVTDGPTPAPESLEVTNPTPPPVPTVAVSSPAANASPGAVPPTPAARWGGQVTAGEPIVRTLQPRPMAMPQAPRPIATVATSPAPIPTPAKRTRPTRTVNIVDLPRHQTTAASQASRTTSTAAGVSSNTADAFQLVSATEPTNQRPATGVGFSAAAGSYGYDPSYAWLRGRLDFSQIDQQWKLRYIPLDGATDDYGGSVVLTDEPKLAGCERGDFVEIRGQVVPGSPASGFSPEYRIAELKRLGTSPR
jgi:hypothetical protein